MPRRKNRGAAGVGTPAAALLLAALLGLAVGMRARAETQPETQPETQAETQAERPIELGAVGAGESPVSLAEEAASALQLHGFAVGELAYDHETGESSFDASVLALSVYRATLGNRLSLFGQLTVHRPEEEPFVTGEGGEESGGGDVETEIDNLQIQWAAAPQAGLDLTFGKLDSPLAIERDDAPLNYQATPSFLLDFGRPVKLTGLMLHEAFSPALEGYAIVANGEDEAADGGHAKTGALYARFSPSLGSHFGLGVIYGNPVERLARTTGVATLLLQPADRWVIGGEAVAGRQERAEGGEGSDRWSGVMLFVHHRFERQGQAGGQWAATLRGEVLDDPDGVRTGTAQRVTSLTLSPQVLVGGGFYGIFHYLDGTSLSLPQVAVRLDLRRDHSDGEVFASADEALSADRTTATLQLVFVF